MFLDFTLPEQVNTYVFPRRDIKSDCKRVCVLDVLPHLYTWCSKISIFGMCCQKNMETLMCNENTKMARERKCVSSSHRAWKRVCVKNVFFCVSSRLESVAVFLAQVHPNPCFCQKLFICRDQKLRKRHATRKTELPKTTWQLQKNAKSNPNKNIKYIYNYIYIT